MLCVCTHRPESVTSPGAGVTGSSKLPGVGAGNQTGLFRRSRPHLTAQSSLHPLLELLGMGVYEGGFGSEHV